VNVVSVHFARPQLLALGRAALDDEFSIETLRDQLDFAATYPDDALVVYGCVVDEIAGLRRWAQEWATQLGLELLQAQAWVDDGEGDG
jgi:hypothetical protein